MIPFNADEVFELAEEIERNGAAYYTKAARQCRDEAARAVLSELAKWETQHERLFHELRDAFQQSGHPATLDDEAAQYLQAFADGKVFPLSDPSKDLTGGESMEEIFHKAIDLEKDSVVFYLGLKELVPDGPHRDQVKAIINEEMRHISLLSRQLAAA